MRAEVRGQVQQVGFSDAVVALAGTLDLAGWVREDEDGAVRVHAEGAPEAVAELRAFLARGPAGAEVERIDEQRAKVEGHEQFAIRGRPAGAFLVHEHAAGFDLHMEVGDTVVSWRLRKSPSMNPSERCMAIGLSSPELPGVATVWDRGPYEQGGRVPWPEAIDRGHAIFVVHGARLRGGFALQRTRDAQWLLVKRRDEHAAS